MAGFNKSNMFIPKKIHVGFQSRNDTFTGKLAYIVYEDEKGVIRKQTSWDGWRDKKIDAVVFDNTPTRYVINKGVQRNGYFGTGRSIARIYDSRDFEFEISIDNLIGILMHSDISKRDIHEECVFAWYGKDLVLLPVNSEEYQSSMAYTDKQSLKVSAKDLVKGYTYEVKKASSDCTLIYIGYLPNYTQTRYQALKGQSGGKKKHVFYDTNYKRFETPSVSTLARVVSEEVHVDFAKLDSQYQTSAEHLRIVDFNVVDTNKSLSTDYYNYLYRKHNGQMQELCFKTRDGKLEDNTYYFRITTYSKDNTKTGFDYNGDNNGSDRELLSQFNISKNQSYWYNPKPKEVIPELDVFLAQAKSLGYADTIQLVLENGTTVNSDRR